MHHVTVPHRLHQAVAGTVFSSVGATLRTGAHLLREADQLRAWGRPLEDSTQGQFLISALNGLVGDQIAERTPAMDIAMGLRVEGRDVRLTRGDLCMAYPRPSERLVVFVHGLCENENYWNRAPRVAADDGAVPGSYGARLAEDLGWTPLYIRANTGATVRESGVALHALLADVVRCWPVPVRQIALVGHSMGGLIIRAACDLNSAEGEWTALISDIVTLGTPHLGSPVERSIALGMRVASRIPELAPYRRIFMQRSAGVLDLSEGLPQPPRPLPRARYRLVAATLTQSTRHPVAIAMGDLLVQPRSAFGQPAAGPALFPDADTLHVPGAHHFDLLNHEDIYTALRGWLAEPVSTTMSA